MITTTVCRALVGGFTAFAALGVGAGVANAATVEHGNPRDFAVAACSDGAGVLVEDDDPNGSSDCYKKGITVGCDPSGCVTIIDDPRLSRRTSGSLGHTATAQR